MNMYTTAIIADKQLCMLIGNERSRDEQGKSEILYSYIWYMVQSDEEYVLQQH